MLHVFSSHTHTHTHTHTQLSGKMQAKGQHTWLPKGGYGGLSFLPAKVKDCLDVNRSETIRCIQKSRGNVVC